MLNRRGQSSPMLLNLWPLNLTGDLLLYPNLTPRSHVTVTTLLTQDLGLKCHPNSNGQSCPNCDPANRYGSARHPNNALPPSYPSIALCIYITPNTESYSTVIYSNIVPNCVIGNMMPHYANNCTLLSIITIGVTALTNAKMMFNLDEWGSRFSALSYSQ